MTPDADLVRRLREIREQATRNWLTGEQAEFLLASLDHLQQEHEQLRQRLSDKDISWQWTLQQEQERLNASIERQKAQSVALMKERDDAQFTCQEIRAQQKEDFSRAEAAEAQSAALITVLRTLETTWRKRDVMRLSGEFADELAALLSTEDAK